MLCALAASIALGCAYLSRPENKLAAPELAGAPGAKSFLVTAPNTVIALPAELNDVTPALREQIDAYLEFHDRDAQWLQLPESRQTWSEAVAEAKKQATIDKAPVYLAERFDQEYDFDAIVMPSILIHKARATYGDASWGGVSRHMEILNRPIKSIDHAQDPYTEGIKHGGVSGEVLVTSIHVLVFSREGQRLFEGRGGFAFLNDADLGGGTWKYRTRNLAKDVDAMREGIAIAFDPYLPEAE